MTIRYNPLRCDGQQVNEYIDETDQAKNIHLCEWTLAARDRL